MAFINSGESAREALADSAFELIISDIELPDGTGLELLRELSSGPGPAPAAIAISGFGSEGDIRQSFAAHLTKPVDVATLEETIGRVACGCAAC
jgi:CheY-like chemotaxis protein